MLNVYTMTTPCQVDLGISQKDVTTRTNGLEQPMKFVHMW